MKRSIGFFFVGLIAGILLTGILLYRLSPSMILKENQSKYNFEETITRFEETVKAGGWKIPVSHDLQETMIKTGKGEVRPMKVIEICKPDLAYEILKTDNERIVSNMMPCRVAFYEKEDGNVYFSRMNSGLLSKPMGTVTRTQMKIAFEETEEFLNEISISGQ